MSDELIKRLQMLKESLEYPGLMEAAETIGEVISALTAPQSQQEPESNWLMKPALEWLEEAEHGADKERCKMIAEILRDLWRQNTTPLSGVRAGMLRAAEIVKSKLIRSFANPDDYEQGWDDACENIAEAITRAADQVNADQPADAVVVPDDDMDEGDNSWCIDPDMGAR